MKILLLLALLLFSSSWAYSQDAIQSLENIAKQTKQKKGKTSAEYILVLARLAQLKNTAGLLAAAKKDLATIDKIRAKHSEVEQSNLGIQAVFEYNYATFQSEILQDKLTTDLIAPNWYYMAQIYGWTDRSMALIQEIYTQYSSQNNIAIQHWLRARMSYEEDDNSIELNNQLWNILTQKATTEFGKKSDEYIGFIFGQANYNNRVKNTEEYTTMRQEVEAAWGSFDQGTPISSPQKQQPKREKNTNISPSDDLLILDMPESMPRFPGCEGESGSNDKKKNCADKAMMNFVFSNISYPTFAKENAIEGMAVIEFVVSQTGTLYAIKVLRDIEGAFGKEITRIITLMNEYPLRWTAGMQEGKQVPVRMRMPIRFKLD